MKKSLKIFLALFFILVICSNVIAESTIIDTREEDKILSNPVKNALLKSMKDVKATDIITFGHYEQDNDLLNGKEDVEWIVLTNNYENREAILISKHILDCLRFNGFHVYATWETSSLRAYMNTTMLNDMFTENEIKCLKKTTLINSPNLFNGTFSGNNTEDYLFIPGIDEMYVFFSNDYFYNDAKVTELLRPNELRIAYATKYAVARGVRVLEKGAKFKGAGNYFLRTTGLLGHRIWFDETYGDFFQSYVSELGEIKPDGTGINSSDDGIRVMVILNY